MEIPILAVTGFITILVGFLILLLAYRSIRRKETIKHRNLMLSAFIVLMLFLIQYIIRAFVFHQETPFTGSGWLKYYIYYPVLVVHISFAIITLGLIIIHGSKSLKLAQTVQDEIVFPKEYRLKHKKLGQITFLLWLFSYLGGSLIFILLYLI